MSGNVLCQRVQNKCNTQSSASLSRGQLLLTAAFHFFRIVLSLKENRPLFVCLFLVFAGYGRNWLKFESSVQHFGFVVL